MQLDGSLSSFPLSELLELSAASLINGAIEVYAPAGTHRLFFAEGSLIHATSSEANGYAALWPLFELEDARFQFVAGALPSERTIVSTIQALITQATAHARQWSTIRPFVPSLHIVPELVSPAHGDHVRIFEEDWPILSSVDGLRSIADVARQAQLEVVEVCLGLLRLKERGLVQFAGPRPPVAPEPAAALVVLEPVLVAEPAPEPVPILQPVPTVEPLGGYFARLLIRAPEAALQAAEPSAPELPATPLEYDDILTVLRS